MIKVAGCLNNAGMSLIAQGQYEEAAAALEESLALAHKLGVKTLLAFVLDNLARVVSAQGDNGRAAELLPKALWWSQELGIKYALFDILGHLAELAVVQGKAERAARLGGAEATGREATGIPFGPAEQEGRKRALSQAREQLGENVYRRAWETRWAMSLEAAYALGESG